MRCRSHSLGWVFATRMIGIICLLIAIVLANILTHYVESPLFISFVAFINENFWLLVFIALILMVGDVFAAFPFPFNLPAPIITAFGSVFFIMFILMIFQWTDTVTSTTISPLFSLLAPIIATMVFLIILISGYYTILRQLWFQSRAEEVHSGGHGIITTPSTGTEQNPPEITDAKSWEEIGAEFRLMLYDVIHRFRQEIRKKQ
ncbi:MAG: hypothetical protein A4E42_01812 [Methanoregulaceae archaeon PtaU1.Bin222]|nr:MAG: hypothetical protein A4E42_01812 [Methanoregulaceae archaeon PtaU1.Bin222]